MTTPPLAKFTSFILALLFVLTACEPSSDSNPVSSDEQIKTQVEAVIARASDLPQQISVEVREGVVFVSGSLACEGCGGLRTPANIGTLQQSLGAVVRAVTGVNAVVFDLSSDI